MERAALRLVPAEEPLVTPAEGGTESYATRQMRRKALRADARSQRRRGSPANSDRTPHRAETPVEAATGLPMTETPPVEPLPRSRALTRQPTGLVARVNAWFSRLVPYNSTKLEKHAPDALAEQMLALRAELSLVQGRLDRMISAVST